MGWRKFLALVCVVGLGVSVVGQKTTAKPPAPTAAPPVTTTPTTKVTTTEITTVAPPPTAAPTTGPTTTTTPAPKYPANEGTWVVTNPVTNYTCIMMKGAIRITVLYQDLAHKNRTANVDVPHDATVTGDCLAQSMTLSWGPLLTTNTMTFFFDANMTEPSGLKAKPGEISGGKFALQNVTGVFYATTSDFVNATSPRYSMAIVNQAAFQTPLNHSYSCLVQEVLKTPDDMFTMKFTDIRMQAYMVGNKGHEFSAAIDCPADDSSDTVPIVVGATLAGLVFIVLVAYLIGRRRSRSRGYQSV